jgi:hypothetical protein
MGNRTLGDDTALLGSLPGTVVAFVPPPVDEATLPLALPFCREGEPPFELPFQQEATIEDARKKIALRLLVPAEFVTLLRRGRALPDTIALEGLTGPISVHVREGARAAERDDTICARGTGVSLTILRRHAEPVEVWVPGDDCAAGVKRAVGRAIGREPDTFEIACGGNVLRGNDALKHEAFVEGKPLLLIDREGPPEEGDIDRWEDKLFEEIKPDVLDKVMKGLPKMSDPYRGVLLTLSGMDPQWTLERCRLCGI